MNAYKLLQAVLTAGVVTAAAAAAARAADTGFRTLDLKPIVNMDWRDEVWGDGKGGWTDQGDNDMRNITVGRRELLGIPFELIDPAANGHRAVLTLGAKKFPAGPPAATVRFGGKARSLYFLHAAAWSGGHMANYIIRYADGTAAEIPIRDREEIMNWWWPTHGPKFRAAVHVPNAQTDDVGLVVFGWDNPQPEKIIAQIELVSLNTDGIVVVTAITASDRPVHLPDPKDIPTPEYLQSDLDTLDPSQWFPVEVVEDKFQPSPIDQSRALDAPAGKHGFMKTVEGRWQFDDGTPVRLVATMQGTPRDKKESAYTARWLAKYGFNLVRIGHLVTGPEPGSAVDWSKPDSGHLNPAVMEQLDYFIAELARHGIYSRPTMLWYRKLKQGDGVDAVQESAAFADQKAKRQPNPKEEPLLDSAGITFFDEKVMAANIALERAILTHRNPYRDNKTWGEDPAVAQIEVTNEDGVFFYTIDGIAPHYAKELDRLWAAWLGKKYGAREKLAAAWGADLKADEQLAAATVKRMLIWELNKVKPERRPRASDQLRFYCELNNGYFQKTKDALRRAGVRQPICGSGWFGVGVGFYPELYSNVPGLDYIDRHHYYGGGPGGWQILQGFTFNYEAALTEPKHLLKLGMERVLGMPYGISEWANVLPNQWRLEAPPIMTFYGQCLNGWEVPIHFALEGGGFTQFLKWMWPVNEPSTLCQYPALAQAIRRGDVREAELVFARNFSDEKLFSAAPLKDVAVKLDISGPYEMSSEQGINARSLASYYAAAVGKTGVRFSKAEQPDFSIDLGKYLDMQNKEIRSVTGELYWNYGKGYLTADTPRVQAAVGFLAGVPVKLAHPDHRGRPLAKHGHGLQPRRPAADRHRQAARAAGRGARERGPGAERPVHRHGTFALRIQDRRRADQRGRRPHRHPVGWPQQGGVL